MLNQYPRTIGFKLHDTEGLTDDARQWLDRLKAEVKMTMPTENSLVIEYPSDIVSQIRRVNVDDCIFRLDFFDPGDKFHFVHCVFPDVPWNNRTFMQEYWDKCIRIENKGQLTLEFHKKSTSSHVPGTQ